MAVKPRNHTRRSLRTYADKLGYHLDDSGDRLDVFFHRTGAVVRVTYDNALRIDRVDSSQPFPNAPGSFVRWAGHHHRDKKTWAMTWLDEGATLDTVG